MKLHEILLFKYKNQPVTNKGKTMKLNKAIADILKCKPAAFDTDEVAHYILNPKDVWNVDTFCMDWDEGKLNNKFILDVWEEEKSVSLSYISEGHYLFNITAFVVSSVYTYQDECEDETEFVIAFQSGEHKEFVIIELEPSLGISIAPFHPLTDEPNKVAVRYKNPNV